MHYEWLDAYLLSFPGVEKDYQPVWQWFRYKVRGRLFAAVCSPGPEYKIYGGHDLVNLKCGAAEGELLRARYPDILPGFYSDKRTWISCLLDGELPEEVELSIQATVLSPGVPTDIPLVNRMRDRGVQILGEIELGFLAEQGRVIAITGTNGKTTTTTLTGDIMRANFGKDKTFVVCNIGNPYTLEADKTSKDSVTVGEISSFQLETIHTFHPVVSAILNITPDHLNRHHTMEAYVAAKEAVASHQTKNDICVLNYDNGVEFWFELDVQ